MYLAVPSQIAPWVTNFQFRAIRKFRPDFPEIPSCRFKRPVYWFSPSLRRLLSKKRVQFLRIEIQANTRCLLLHPFKRIPPESTASWWNTSANVGMHTREPQLEDVLPGRRSKQILTKESTTFVYGHSVADVFNARIIGGEREMF